MTLFGIYRVKQNAVLNLMSPVSFTKAVTGKLKIKYTAPIMVLSDGTSLKEARQSHFKRDLMKRLTDLGNELTGLLYSTKSAAQCYVPAWMAGRVGGDKYMYVYS